MDELTVLSYLSLYSVNETDDKVKIGSFRVKFGSAFTFIVQVEML